MDQNIILEHEYVPEHVVMKNEEVDELLKKYGITKQQLPKIKATDPIAVLMGVKRGQVLRIIRKSLTAGKTDYYRLVW